jgi:membrane protein DedA with SNARE-associated domain
MVDIETGDRGAERQQNRIARPPRGRSRWLSAVLWGLFAVVAVTTGVFALRTYHSLVLLHSAYRVGAPDVNSIRAWMTLRYVASTYGRAPETTLAQRLALAPDTSPDTTLRSLAEREGASPFQYVQRVQQALADVAPVPHKADTAKSWFGTLRDKFLGAMLVYGYPALGLTLLLGAIGLPFPTGLSTVLAGSLAAQDRLSWFGASVLAVVASVVGDVIGYGLGRLLGREFLERWGRWIGFTPAKRQRVSQLFDQWGAMTVLLTRTLIEPLSAVANLLAGLARYQLAEFVVYVIAGRLLWTAAFFGLGYGIGGDLEAATGFLTNLTGFLVCLVASTALAFTAFKRRHAIRHVQT